MRATAVPRAESGPLSPVYHETVLADVPATSVVAVANGGPATRSGAGFAVPVAPEATNAIDVPLTVIVSPGAKLVVSESVPAAPDSSVAPVIGAGTAALLLTAP